MVGNSAGRWEACLMPPENAEGGFSLLPCAWHTVGMDTCRLEEWSTGWGGFSPAAPIMGCSRCFEEMLPNSPVCWQIGLFISKRNTLPCAEGLLLPSTLLPLPLSPATFPAVENSIFSKRTPSCIFLQMGQAQGDLCVPLGVRSHLKAPVSYDKAGETPFSKMLLCKTHCISSLSPRPTRANAPCNFIVIQRRMRWQVI